MTDMSFDVVCVGALANISKFPIKNLYPRSVSWGRFAVGATCHQGYQANKVLADLHDLGKPWEGERTTLLDKCGK